LKHSDKPTLLMLTSSFPSSAADETCGYIREFARRMSVEFNVTVLAPADRHAVECPFDVFKLIRSRSVVPLSLDPFQAGDDLNSLVSKGPLAKLAALVSLVCFFAHAMLLAARADVICSHWMVPSGLAGALISRLLGKPHVVVEHSGALHLLGRMRGGARIARFILDGSDRIVTVSGDLKNKLVGSCRESETKVEVVPMGVKTFLPPRHEHTKPHKVGKLASCSFESLCLSGKRSVLFIGRLTAIKGLDILLRAIEGSADIHLIVAGDGEARRGLEAMAKALSVNATFIGRINAAEREQLLSLCDAVVIPSRVLPDGRTEGTPVVCLEAMAAGRAVIASRAGGLAELISDGETGFLFEQGDDRMLRHKLMLALSDDSLRQMIGENARRSVTAYDWSRLGVRFSEILIGVMRKRERLGSRRIESGGIRG